MTLYAMKPIENKTIAKAPPLRQVTVEKTDPGVYPVRVKAYGEVAAKWTTTIKSQVGGRIIRINEHLQPGYRINAGDVIVELDQVNYQMALGQAELEYENARVNLIQVERQASQAVADWKNSGIKQTPTSPLVFHGPQLKAARARLTYAKQAIEKAKNDLNQTLVRAPYNSLVTERFVGKGETLFAGDRILTLVSSDEIEIRVSLDASQVQRLGKFLGRHVDIRDDATGRSWTGKVIRDGGRVDRQTRLRHFFIQPVLQGEQRSQPALIPGMFITAIIKGENIDSLVRIPESSLTREGDIWYVDSDDRLQQLKAKIAFYSKGHIFVKNTFNLSSMNIVTAPAPGFVAGTKIIPVAKGDR